MRASPGPVRESAQQSIGEESLASQKEAEMGTVIGVLIGYAFGTRAGDEGWTEFRESWKVIASSEEVRDLMGTGLTMAREILGKGSKGLGGVFASSATSVALRRAA